MNNKEKTIIILSGIPDGKTKFVEIIKKHGFWTWNINPHNVVGTTAKTLGWDMQERDETYYDFISEIERIANKYWNFKDNYISSTIQRFKDNPKPDVLIVHGCDVNAMREIIEKNLGTAFSIRILPSGGQSQNHSTKFYDKKLYFDDCFEESVLETIEILTKGLGD